LDLPQDVLRRSRFFQEEIEECLAFLKKTIAEAP